MNAELYRYYRTAAYLTRTEFAASLGVCLKTIERWESVKSTPNLEQARKLAQHCAAYHVAYVCPCCEVTR